MTSNKISNIYIKDLFNNCDICWSIKDVNVLVGKNGLGKSTILELIKASLTKDLNSRALKLCHGIQIFFNENQPNETKNHLFNPSKMKDDIISRITDTDFIDKIINNINNNKINNKNNKLLRDEIISTIINEVNDDVKIQAVSQNTVELPIEYISTVSMSANSIKNINTSDGKIVNFLDYEIKEEIQKLLKSDNSKKNINKLISVLNNMFADSQKKVVLQDDNLYFILENKHTINYESLSSGERQVIYIFIKVINASNNNALILMDEPEISLHLSWQEMLLSEIRKVNKHSQIIIVTHSPAIVMNGWMDSFIDIKDIISINEEL